MSQVAFHFGDAEIRTITTHGDPWFVARDVVEALGYRDPGNAIRTHCKRAKLSLIHSGGQTRHVNVVPESDVYRLVFRSSLPSAERFVDWVVEEVLPSIRKTGGYSEDDMTEHARIVSDRVRFSYGETLRRNQALYIELQAYKRRFGELDVDD